jgi:hypothetical protein
MAEWLKAHAWKACVRETVPWVRIPLSPPRHSTTPYPIVRSDSKTTSNASKVVAANSAMLSLATAQTVASVGSEDALEGEHMASKLKPLDVERKISAQQILRFMGGLRREPMSRPDWALRNGRLWNGTE